MKTSIGLKAYGVGIMPSSERMKNTLSIKETFNVENVLNKNFKIDRVQNKYFIINSFE